MRGKSAVTLLIILALTIVLGIGAISGYSYWTSEVIDGQEVWTEHEIMPGIKSIRKGLDVAGGVRLIYTIEDEKVVKQVDGQETIEYVKATADDIHKIETILRTRLDTKGLTEATITVDTVNPENQMIIVEIPGFDDPEEASAFLGKTAKLQFVDSEYNVILEGEDIVGATAEYDRLDNLSGYQHFIQLNLSDAAVQKFGEATERVSQLGEPMNYIAIVLDDMVISSPRVQEKIAIKNPTITGNFQAEEAKELADLISSGALPFNLVVENQEYVGPTIGQKAFDITVYAGIIAFILIILFLIFVYRLPGLVSTLALVIYTIAFILICEYGGVIITLPGIAGIILSIAMAVDASIITYERLREELKAGKTIKTSVDSSFSKAFSTVRDSSITTFISAIVLYILGTGSIQGFAISLMIGLVLSFLMAIFLLKFLLRNLTNVIQTKNTWFYGVKKKAE